MVVIHLANCPPKLRGDLTKWLCEINTGVYVGNVSARVRDEIWDRVCENLKNGSATMVFNAQNEQKMDFRVHNTTWMPVDFDGIKLIRRPISGQEYESNGNVPAEHGFSKAAKMRKAEQMNYARQKKQFLEGYVVIDIETTGLSAHDDHVIELAALKVVPGKEEEVYSSLVKWDGALPKTIIELTGITDDMLQKEGKPLKEALSQFLEFIGDKRIVGHNVIFDMDFIYEGCRRCGLEMGGNTISDTLTLARRKVKGVMDYKLSTVAKYYQIEAEEGHRALQDCYVTKKVYEKLNEN